MEENIPSCMSVPNCVRSIVEYISRALMMGGGVEFSILESKKSYVWLISKMDVECTMLVRKYFGVVGPYQCFPFRVMLNDLD